MADTLSTVMVILGVNKVSKSKKRNVLTQRSMVDKIARGELIFV